MKTLVLSILVLGLVGCSGGKNSTGYSIINDMMYSEAYEAFSDNPHFDNGQSMQAAPEGAIARGKMPQPVDSEGQPVIQDNPYEMTGYTWKRGEILFNRTCSACHGMAGKGNGLVVTEGGFPKPPNFKSRTYKYSKKAKYPAGVIFNVITHGRGNMASHAQQLYVEDRWYVAEYVREMLMVKGKK
jgi:mono/diheme cytochrome c family protein